MCVLPRWGFPYRCCRSILALFHITNFMHQYDGCLGSGQALHWCDLKLLFRLSFRLLTHEVVNETRVGVQSAAWFDRCHNCIRLLLIRRVILFWVDAHRSVRTQLGRRILTLLEPDVLWGCSNLRSCFVVYFSVPVIDTHCLPGDRHRYLSLLQRLRTLFPAWRLIKLRVVHTIDHACWHHIALATVFIGWLNSLHILGIFHYWNFAVVTGRYYLNLIVRCHIHTICLAKPALMLTDVLFNVDNVWGVDYPCARSPLLRLHSIALL